MSIVVYTLMKKSAFKSDLNI